jgi:hypothetical protein
MNLTNIIYSFCLYSQAIETLENAVQLQDPNNYTVSSAQLACCMTINDTINTSHCIVNFTASPWSVTSGSFYIERFDVLLLFR